MDNKRIIIDLEKNGVDISSNDLQISYCNFMNFHGLQCNHEGDTPKYNEMFKILDDISDNVKKLNNLYL